MRITRAATRIRAAVDVTTGAEEEVAAEEPKTPEHAPLRKPRPEAASTRRALARGYTLLEIKNARERLKRHVEIVVREDRGNAEGTS